MFKQYCKGCPCKEHCFNFAECLREKTKPDIDHGVVEGENQLSEQALLEHRILMSDVPIFRHESNT